MITQKLTEYLLRSASVDVDQVKLTEAFEDLALLQNLTPFEVLQFAIKRLGINDLTVAHASTTQLDDSNLPGIIFDDDMWRLIEKKDNLYVVTDDVTGDQREVELEELPVTVVAWLERRTNNYDGEVAEKPITTREMIFNVFKEHPVWLVNIGVATVMVNIFAVVSSLFAMQVYDRVVPTLAMETLTSLVAGVLIIYFVDWLLKMTRSKIVDHNSSYIDKKISKDIYKRLLNVQLDKLPSQVGTLTAQINGLESVRQFFSSTIVFSLVDMPFALMFLFVIYTIGGEIAFVYAGFLVISVAMALVAQNRSKGLTEKLVMRSNEKLGVLVDSIKGKETIRSIGSHQSFEHEWNEINESTSKYGLEQKKISTTATTTSQSFGQVSYVIAIVIGVYLIGEGELTMGGMIACSILGGRVLGPVGQAVGHLVQYENVAQSMKMIDAFLAIPEQRNPKFNYVFPDVRPSRVVLQNVQFAYSEEGQNTVDIAELSIKQGERVALLGSIGSGKSTLLKLIAGLYKPTTGRLRVGEADLWELDPDYIAKNVGYLPQTPDLFKGTLKSNLTLGRDVGDTRLLSVINLLGLSVITDQSEKGLELPVSEGGSGLSGGQKQLVGIARLFVGNASIWLLDEPTASLDPQTQAKVVEAIRVRMRPTDILVFATHNPKLAVDLSTRVIVMNGGKVVNDAPTSSVQLRSKPSVKAVANG